MSVLRKIALVTLAWVAGSWAQAVNQIRINQIGWNPEDPKTFVLATPAVSSATTFQVLRQGSTTPIFSGTLGASEVWASSGENARVGDFSAFKETGSFVINIPGVGSSWPFEIQNNIYDHITRAALKMFYFQRASFALEPAWAGQWARAMGHPDTAVKIHNAAETPARPTGFLVRSPGGWYDAGDYNKYILTAGISMWTLMAAYEHNTSYFDTLQIGIPEDNNGLPSIVSELLYELRWLLTMQDPNDGGVYNKLTSAGFGGISVMPAKNTASRYMVPKNTDATLEFAAITAYSARFLKPFESKLPGLSDSCLKAAKQAWAWARKYPDSQYTQGALTSPSVETGIYANANGALTWAGTELWLTTAQDSFYNIVKPTIAFTTPNWADVRSLPLLSIMFSKNAAAQAKLGQANLQAALADLVRRDSVRYTTSAFRLPMASFAWGSNGTNSNLGMLSIMAAKSTGATGLYTTGNHILDYLLGRNGIGVSFLTGYGDSVPKDPHHRPSVGDGVKEPVPGFLVGGPNPGREDARLGQACNIAGIKYPSLLAAKSWIDHNCSYASNEVAINWNAPFVYLAGSLAAQRAKPVTNRAPITGLAPGVVEAGVRVTRMAGVYIFRGQEKWRTTSVRIVDLSGQTVSSLQNAGQEVRWAPQNLKSGLYFAQVQGNNQMQTVPLMIP